MQYWRPGRHFYVGDCLPFYHGGVFHFAYLLDRGHHTSKGGLGAHQWVQTTSTDLVHWQDEPMMIPVTDQREGSICTGSVYPHEGTYYAFYATRLGDWSEHLSLAVSPDGIHYTKTQPTLILSPGPELRKDFRDPHVFRDPGTGLFHLLIAAVLQADGKGLLAHYTSSDLKQWKEEAPFLAGLPLVPECPDYFEWKGWYYLVFSQAGVAHYRISRSPLGPWTAPEVDVFDGDQIRVLKTAGFTGNRRLGAAFLPVSPDRYAGHAVFRELIQHEDGSLGSHFPEEMLPKTGKRVALSPMTLTNARAEKGGLLRIGGADTSGSALLDGLPHNARLRLTLEPAAGIREYGLRLGASATGQGGAEVRFSPSARQVRLAGGPSLSAVDGLDRKPTLDIILKDDILDLCVDGRRTLISRIPAARGEQIGLFSEGGALSASGIDLRPLK
ncbi:MAG TPA: glycoside hydrolase family 32 protein [Armatimonadota bacterium]